MFVWSPKEQRKDDWDRPNIVLIVVNNLLLQIDQVNFKG